jgi:hypothetical protein
MSTVSQLRETDRITAKYLAYEYLLAKMSEWYCREKALSDEKFNAENDFTLTKLLLYPFFACIANGSFNTLYDFFGPFYAFDDGPTSSISLTAVLGNGNMHYFYYDEKKTQSLKVENEYAIENGLQAIQNKILETSLELNNGGNVKFNALKFEVDGKIIASAISSSISAIEKQTDGKFICYDNYQIGTLAKQHRSWSTIYSYYSTQENAEISDFIIPKEEAEKDRKIYMSSEQLQLV